MLKQLKRSFAFISAITMAFAMLLYFPSETFSNIDLGFTASADTSSCDDITFTAITGDPPGNAGEGYANLFDGNTGTKWCGDVYEELAYVIFKASNAITVKKYVIATANDTATNDGRNPKTWTLYGCNDYSESNNNGSWTAIDTIEDGNLPLTNETYAEFSVSDTSKSYQYFKFEVTALAKEDNNLVQFSELELTCHDWQNTGDTVAPTCTDCGYDVQKCSSCQATRKVENGTPANGHKYNDNGFCTGCGGYEPATVADTGTYLGYYEISNAGQLYWFAGLVNGTLTDGTSRNSSANAVLTDDIIVNQGETENAVANCKGTKASGWLDWTPIGTNVCYRGVFNGQNHTISGLYFNDDEADDVGLFGSIDGCNVSNVGVVDLYFSGINNVGGICGSCINNSNLTNCYNTGTVEGIECVGGVCGYIHQGKISNCYNKGSVSGSTKVGGAFGFCYSFNNLDNSEILCCYNTGTVTGKTEVGGVCGYIFYGNIKNSYNIGTINCKKVKGSVCAVNENGDISNCYYLADTEDENGGKTATQFASGEVTYLLNESKSYGAWGQTIGTDSYPVLGGVSVIFTGGEYKNIFENTKAEQITAENYSKFNFTADNYTSYVGYYAITNKYELYWFAGLVNGTLTDGTSQNTSANAVLINDIIVNQGETANAVANCDGTKASGWLDWTPIGTNYDCYKGIFDGQNHTISGLYFNDDEADNVGLFGHINNGKVSNVGVVDSYFSGYDYVSGICGESYDSNLTNCYNTGTVDGLDCIGGVCGKIVGSNSIVSNCYNKGSVSGSTKVGGVCGHLFYAEILCCYNIGSVSGLNKVGGVCGNIDNGNIKNSYNIGTIDCSRIKGSVFAVNENGDGDISNCYYLADTDDKNGGKTSTQFENGEVAYLLSQGYEINEVTYSGDVWGQDLSKDDYPVLNGKKVLANVDKSKFANDVLIYGQSATLDGTIGVNFYVIADDECTDWTVTINGKDVAKSAKDSDGRYKFTYGVAAKEMDEEIAFVINLEGKEKDSCNTSVSTYLEGLEESETDEIKNLAESMQTYGNAAEAYFSGTIVGSIDDVPDNVFESNSSAYYGNNPAYKSYFTGGTLILKNETTMRFYFDFRDGDISNYKFTIDGNEVTAHKKGDYFYVDIENISADKLNEKHDVCLIKKDENLEIAWAKEYSLESYGYNVCYWCGDADHPEIDENLKNLVKALYKYNQSAIAYKNSPSQS